MRLVVSPFVYQSGWIPCMSRMVHVKQLRESVDVNTAQRATSLRLVLYLGSSRKALQYIILGRTVIIDVAPKEPKMLNQFEISGYTYDKNPVNDTINKDSITVETRVSAIPSSARS